MNTAPNTSPQFRTLHWILAALIVGAGLIGSPAQESGATNTTAAKPDEPANTSEAFRSYLQLQEQLHTTQMALERNRQESEALAARNADAIAARLKLIEQAVASQRDRELEAMQSANRLLLIVAGSFAGVGFIAMLLTAYLQWRSVNRLAEFTSLLPLAGRAALPAPGQAEAHLLGATTTERSNARFTDALNRLEKRILEIEHTAHAPVSENSIPAGDAEALPPAATSKTDHVALLLAKGQSLLNLEKSGEALGCYDEILATEPNHPEALVKKGIALEQLRQIDDALSCYDRAIALDGSLTVAYLQKGGLYNRLERYEEALKCYEEALRSQEKPRAS